MTEKKSDYLKKNWETATRVYGPEGAQKMLDMALAEEVREAKLAEQRRKAAEREAIRQEAFSEVESEIEVMESQIQTKEEALEEEIEATRTERGNIFKLETERGEIYDAYLKKLMEYKKQLQEYELTLTRENFKIVEEHTNEILKPVVKLAAMMAERKLSKGTIEIRMNDDGSFFTIVGVTPNDKPREYTLAEAKAMFEKTKKRKIE